MSPAHCTASSSPRSWRFAPITQSGPSPANASAIPVGMPTTVPSPTGAASGGPCARSSSAGERPCATTNSPPTQCANRRRPPGISRPICRARSSAVWATRLACAPGSNTASSRPKTSLGWADYRLTDAHSIERWWELVMSAYTLVSLQSLALAAATLQQIPPAASFASVTAHPLWAGDAGWKHQLNNLRLLLQPYVCAALLLPWLRLFDLPHLQRGLADACSLMNAFHLLGPT